MPAIIPFKLELLRSGPAHNQLLSPLTPYVALAGIAGPQTVQLPFEHRQLLARLARLRYTADGHDIGSAQREETLRETGEALGRLLGEVAALKSALDGVQASQGELLHLRLSTSALELGLVPFEAAIAPEGFQGSGGPLLLRTPTVLTREVRRPQRIEVHWDRPPRILFAHAAPQDLAPVPARDHLAALHRAVAPTVRRGVDEAAALAALQRHVVELPDATLSALAETCRREDFTHVHILAHGAPFDEAGARRYGVALASSSGGIDVVDGERLGLALRGQDVAGRAKLPPTVVSLATCDSGAVDSVLIPGGSIAHELHAQGIPWVLASQFPLWMRSSVIVAERFYGGLLAGHDPRRVLHELRQRLRTEVPDTHDWASLVAYAVSPWDFEAQIEAFRDRQVRASLEANFARLDEQAAAWVEGADSAPLQALASDIRRAHADWLHERAHQGSAADRARRLGMGGANEKRLAVVFGRSHQPDLAVAAYRRALGFYEQSVQVDPANHWGATQVLSLRAIRELCPDDDFESLRREHRDAWVAAMQIARWEMAGAAGEPSEALAWAITTQAELELLGSVYHGRGFKPQVAAERLRATCRRLIEVAGAASFPVAATRRQFLRYRDQWPRKVWAGLAQAALDALGPAPD